MPAATNRRRRWSEVVGKAFGFFDPAEKPSDVETGGKERRKSGKSSSSRKAYTKLSLAVLRSKHGVRRLMASGVV